MNSSRRSGTSLVEVLVVIVVFLVGILAIVQIFPGGFRVLSTTQKNSIATALGRAMIESLKSHADQLPEAIVPVSYFWNGSQIVISAQPDRYPNELGPVYSNMDVNGTMFDAGGNPIGNWQFLTGSNVGRRVLGEGRVIPTPRLVGAQYGSLLSLQFAPLVYNPIYQSLFIVYGNDMVRRQGDPQAENLNVRFPVTDYYVDNEDNAQAAVFVPMNPAKPMNYRMQITVYTSPSGRRDLVDFPINAPAGTGWWKETIANDIGTDTLNMVDYDSIRVSRQFDQVANSTFFTGDPYEYVLLSQQLGLVLFNPAGYNYTIRRPGGRRDPLVGRVSYDVYDWRIIHDEFRLPQMYPASYRLAVGSLKVTNEQGPDGRPITGIGVSSPDSTATMNSADLVIEDTDSASLVVFQEGTVDPHLTSFTVNKSIGMINFLDYDSDPSNGTQVMMVSPGAAAFTLVTVDNRSLQALYMGKSEWAVQVMKPAAKYTEVWNRPGIGQFFIGQSDTGLTGSPSRIYFPEADAGRVVSLGEVYYFNTNGVEVGPLQLTAKVQTNNQVGGGFVLGLPYIEMTQFYSDFSSFDYNYASAVKSVKGASVAVRVLWNPDHFNLTTDAPTNMDRLDKWMQGWRRSTVETYLQRGY